MFSYDDVNENPPCPVIKLRITDSRRGLIFETFDAIVDTGSDVTCIPRFIANRTANISYDPCGVDDIEAGKRVGALMVRITRAIVEFLDANDNVRYTGTYRDLKLLVRSEGVLGRDVLNMHASRFHGLSSQWFLEDDTDAGHP